MSDAWFYAVMIPASFLFGWHAQSIWMWTVSKFKRPGDEEGK